MAKINIWTKIHTKSHRCSMLYAALFAALPIFGSPAMGGTIQQISAQDDAIIVRFDDIVQKADIFALAGPNRIAVDISGATAGVAALAGGSAYSIRQGQFSADTARVVVDLAQPVVITSATFSPDGNSLRLNLRPSGALEFADVVAKGKTQILPPLAFRAEPPKRRYEVTAPIRSNLAKGCLKSAVLPTAVCHWWSSMQGMEVITPARLARMAASAKRTSHWRLPKPCAPKC